MSGDGISQAGVFAQIVYRLRAALGRRATIAWTLTVLILRSTGQSARARISGSSVALWHRTSQALTLTAPQNLAAMLRRGRDRALDHAARRAGKLPATGARHRLGRAWVGALARVGYALDHQANRLTWRLARTLRALERECVAPMASATREPYRPSRVTSTLGRLGAAAWAGVEGVARGVDWLGRRAIRAMGFLRSHLARLGRTLRPWPAALARRLRLYPWRQLGHRALVPGQCAACILFGLVLIRRGDMVHMLAGGLLVTAFVLMAVVYTWMLYHPPQTAEGDAPADLEPPPVVEAEAMVAAPGDAAPKARRQRAPRRPRKPAAPPLANDMLPGL